jgi:penicillin-binding protein 1A
MRKRKSKFEPRTRWQRILLRYGWILPVGTVVVGAGILLVTYAFASIPLPRDIEIAASTEVYDVNGKLIGTYSEEGFRFLIDIDELLEKNPTIGHAVIAAEDRDFYDHNGVSLRGIVRAAWANLTGGEVQQGGSTITQQYVKQAILQDPERTITRKAKEAILAIKLEREYSKDEILGFYLNTIYLGRGAYGIEAAADAYFSKDAEDLTLAEVAFIASVIPSPESYQPEDDMKAARERRDRVLDNMVAEGYVTQAEADEASAKKIKITHGVTAADREKDQTAAYFMEWLRENFLEAEFPDGCLYTCGLKIHTTLDLEMQEAAERTVAENLNLATDPQAAVVSMTPRGEVRAMVGGWSKCKEGPTCYLGKTFTKTGVARGFNYATGFPGRQAGSSFKPFTLLAAIEEGISPRSTLSGSSPAIIEDEECYTNGEPWEVDNYGGSSFGNMDLIQATTNSVNTIYAQLVAEVGADKVADLLEEFGFNPKYGAEEITPVCSLALGTYDVTPLEMARAYAGFAGRGAVPHVIPVRYVTNSNGDCIIEYVSRKGNCEEEEDNAPDQQVEQNSADVLTSALETVVTSGTAQAANIGRPAAGKTGTTQNNANAWFGGYTPQLATVVWVGYPLDPGPDEKYGIECGAKKKNRDKQIAAQNACAEDNYIPQMQFCADPALCRPVHGIEVTGGSFPAEIWGQYMAQAVADMEVQDFVAPTSYPGELIEGNIASPTAVPTREPDEEPEPEPSTEPEPIPSEEPSTEPSPQPTIVPTPEPSASGAGGNGNRTKRRRS